MGSLIHTDKCLPHILPFLVSSRAALTNATHGMGIFDCVRNRKVEHRLPTTRVGSQSLPLLSLAKRVYSVKLSVQDLLPLLVRHLVTHTRCGWCLKDKQIRPRGRQSECEPRDLTLYSKTISGKTTVHPSSTLLSRPRSTEKGYTIRQDSWATGYM